MTILTHLISLLRSTLEARPTREWEEGSHTTDIILWVVAVVALVALAAAGVTTYINGQLAALG